MYLVVRVFSPSSEIPVCEIWYPLVVETVLRRSTSE